MFLTYSVTVELALRPIPASDDPYHATPWKGLRAAEISLSGSTLRRRLADWAQTDVLWHVHSMLVDMLRSQKTLEVHRPPVWLTPQGTDVRCVEEQLLSPQRLHR